MAIVDINRKLFEKEIGKLDEKMQEKITMLGTPIEKLTKDELQVEISPNRPDLLSYHGLKRALLAFLDRKTGLQKYRIKRSKETYSVIVNDSLKEIRPYTSCAVIKGLRLNSEKIKEIIEIQEKLHLTLGRKRKKFAIGIYPLDEIKFPVHFTALEPDKIKFIPLESEREMSGLEILQRHPAGKEYADLLAGKTKFPIFIDSENKILSMPPVINSKTTGRVTEKTRDIFVECSGFDRKVLDKCINILASMFADMGGAIHEVEMSHGSEKKPSPNLETEKMEINSARINTLLGLNLKEEEIKKLLERMGYGYSKGVVEIPPWRIDILHEVDIGEDIAIAYGYDKFIPEIPPISSIGAENPHESVKRKAAEILSGLGMLEVSNYHLTTKREQFENMGEKIKPEIIEVENSKTDYNILRENLSHYLMKILSENVNNDFPQKIFEIGKVFSIKNDMLHEHENLAIAISPGNFTELRQAASYLFRMLGIEIRFEEPKETPGWIINGRAASFAIEKEIIGYIGEVHPKILKNWKARMPVAILEVSFDKILEKIHL
ncbi:MAG: phenylalanine--tRNA ligase subunit beta [Nanoarchaeota archaeon]|nr:phenylalanine--tRNA ligase subunit beta [Nanoarchaeota archaeon]